MTDDNKINTPLDVNTKEFLNNSLMSDRSGSAEGDYDESKVETTQALNCILCNKEMN